MTRLRTLLFFIAVLTIVTIASAQRTVAAPPPDSDVQVEPREGPPGTTFIFHAAGYNINERVLFWATAPDGTTVGSTAGRTEAGGTGRASWSWVAPSSARPGTWVMVGRGKVSGVQQVILFQITSLNATPTPVESANTGVAPQQGGAGTRFVFHADGFTLGERVGFWLTAPDGSTLPLDERAVALSDGRVEWTWLAPMRAQPGTWLMVAHGIESGIERVVPFGIV